MIYVISSQVTYFKPIIIKVDTIGQTVLTTNHL